jgi:hypothetical protein
LAGKEIAGFRVHDIPNPLVIPLLILFLDEYSCLVRVPDVTDINFVLLSILAEKMVE